MPPRKYKKKPRKYKRNKLISMGVPSGIPTTRMASLRYDDVVRITSTTSSLASYVFRANGLYDPDFSGSGHQPFSYDTWSSLYNHYTVLGAKITVTCVSEYPETEIYWAGVYLSDTASVPYSSGSSFREARKGQSLLKNPSYGKPSKLTSKFSAKQFFHLSDVNDNTDRVGAIVTADPPEGANFIFWVQAINAGTVAVDAAVTIEYIVQFSEPKDLVPS